MVVRARAARTPALCGVDDRAPHAESCARAAHRTARGHRIRGRIVRRRRLERAVASSTGAWRRRSSSLHSTAPPSTLGATQAGGTQALGTGYHGNEIPRRRRRLRRGRAGPQSIAIACRRCRRTSHTAWTAAAAAARAPAAVATPALATRISAETLRRVEAALAAPCAPPRRPQARAWHWRVVRRGDAYMRSPRRCRWASVLRGEAMRGDIARSQRWSHAVFCGASARHRIAAI